MGAKVKVGDNLRRWAVDAERLFEGTCACMRRRGEIFTIFCNVLLRESTVQGLLKMAEESLRVSIANMPNDAERLRCVVPRSVVAGLQTDRESIFDMTSLKKVRVARAKICRLAEQTDPAICAASTSVSRVCLSPPIKDARKLS